MTMCTVKEIQEAIREDCRSQHGVIMPYSFPFLQMGLFVLVLFGLEVILSFWTMRRQKNQSLVEEMRAME